MNLSFKNPFDEKRIKRAEEQFEKQTLEEFRVKPFHKRTKSLAIFLMLLGAVCSVVSAITESVFLFEKLNNAIPYKPIVYILVCVLIIVIEGAKRYSLSPTLRHYFTHKSIDYFSLIPYLIIVLVSISFSFFGSKYLPAMTSDVPLISVDSVSISHDILIADAVKSEQDYFIKNEYKGKINHKLTTTYNTLVKAIQTAKDDKKKAIEDTKKENKNRVKNYNIKNQKTGVQLGYISVLCELFLLGIMSFIVYRKYCLVLYLLDQNDMERYDTSNDTNDTSNDTFTHSPSNDNRFFSANLRADTQETKIVTGNENRSCENCGNDYQVNHKKQKYCSNSCRLEAYKRKNKGT